MSETIGEIQQVAASSSIGINLELFKMGPILHVLIAVSVTTAVMVATGVTVVAVASGASFTPPIARPDSVTTFKTSPINIFPLSNDVDPRNDKLTLLSVSPPPFGSIRIFESSYVVYTPQLYWAGVLIMNYTVTNQKLSAFSNITVTVKNNPPEPATLVYQISKNSKDNVARVMTDRSPRGTVTVDVDRDLLFIARIASAPRNGTASISSNGQTILYTPNKDFIASDTLVYEISDYNDTAQATITFIVNNDPPTAQPDFYDRPRNIITILNVLENDFDVNGDRITISSVFNSGTGKATITSDELFIRYFPQFGVYSDSFEYTITDGQLFSTTYVVINMVASTPAAGTHFYTIGKNSVNNTLPFNYSSPDLFVTLHVAFTQRPTIGTTTLLLNAIKTTSQLYPNEDVYVDWMNNEYTLLYTPALQSIGLFNFTYEVVDGKNKAIGFIYVNVINQPPVAVNDNFTTTKNIPITVNPLLNDFDPNNDQIRLRSPMANVFIPTQRGGNITWASNTTIIYNPPRNFVGEDIVDYIIEDVQSDSSANLPATGRITFNIGVAPPVAVADSYVVNKGTPINLNVLLNDFDTAGDPVTVISVSSSSYGTPLSIVTVNGVTQISYQSLDIVSPNDNFDVFTYTIQNPAGLTSTATVSVRLINSPPVAIDDSVSIMWNTSVTISVLNNDTDPNLLDIPKLIISSITTNPTSGSSSIVGKTILYTPTLGFVGTDSLQYTCNDLLLDSNIATVRINVLNDAPVAVADSYTVFWGRTSIFDVIANDFDPNSNPIAIISTNYNNQNGIVSITNDNKVQFAQTDNFVGLINFTYTITDWNRQSTALVIVNITNTPPVAINDVYTMHFRQLNNELTVLNNDFDTNGLTLTLLSNTNPSIGTATINSNRILFSNNGGIGTSVFQYTISNGGSAFNTAVGTVTINLINLSPPVSSPLSTTVHWRTYYTGVTLNVQPSQFTASGDQINVFIATNPNQGGSAIVQGTGIQNILYRQFQSSSSGWNFVRTGLETFNFTLSDGGINSTNRIEVTTFNNAPTGQDISLTTLNQGPVTVNVLPLCSDVDPEDQPNLQIVSVFNLTETPSSTGTVSISNGQVVYTPNAGFSGVARMSYTVTDGLWNTTNTITITVFQNIATVKSYTIHWSPNPVDISFNVTRDIVSVIGQNYLSNPFNLTVPPQAGALVSLDTSIGTPTTRTNVLYRQRANSTGSDTFQVLYFNGFSHSTITVYITITNTPPVAQPASGTTHWRNPSGITITTNCTDINSDKTYITSLGSTNPSNRGTATIQSTNSIRYIPNAANPFSGSVTFSYTCTDGISTSSAIVTVTHTNTAPFANSVSNTYHWRTYRTSFTVNLTQSSSARDVNADNIFLSSVGSPSNSQAGTIFRTSNGLVNITANPSINFVGTYSFPFTISDGLLTHTNTCTITVFNNPPQARNDHYTVPGTNPPTVISLNVLSNDTDPDSNDIPFLTITSTTKGVINSRNITYTAPAIGFVGVDTFQYTITDGISSSTATVFVTVTATPPVANPDSLTIHWSATSPLLDLTRNDVGYDSFVGIIQNPSWGQVNVVSPGNITYRANSILSWTTNGRNQTLTDTFTYRISSNYALTATGTVTATITNVIPLAVADSYTFPANFLNPQQILDVRSNDNSGDSDSITINSINPMNIRGTITTNGTTIFYTPRALFFGTETFSYTLFDGQTVSNSVNVTVTINPPSLTCSPHNINITKESGFNLDLSTLVTSSGNYPLTYSLLNSSPRGVSTLTGSQFSFQATARHSTPVTQTINYRVGNTHQNISCPINIDFYNSAPFTTAGQVVVSQPKGTRSFILNVLQNWTDPNPGDIPFLRIQSVQNVSCADAVVLPDQRLLILMKVPLQFTGICTLPYTVSDMDLNNPRIANSTIAGLLIAIVTNPPVAVQDYVYVRQASGPAIIPISTILSNDYSIDVGAPIVFNRIICRTGQCRQTPFVSGNNIIWPNSEPLSCNGDTFDYEIGSPILTATTTVTIVVTNCVCTNVAIDLMFLIDGSGSISNENWRVVRAFCANVTTYFTVGGGPTQTRVGAIQFSAGTTTHIRIFHSEATSQTGVFNTLSTITQLDSSTATLPGLQEAMRQFATVTTQAPERRSVAKVIVLTTDGQPNVPCSCSCCEWINATRNDNGCSRVNNTFYSACGFNPAGGRFCTPCASPVAYARWINSLQIRNNNSAANHKVVAMGIGSALLEYNNYGWNTVRAMNFDPNLALQVDWANINQAVQVIVDAACSSVP